MMNKSPYAKIIIKNYNVVSLADWPRPEGGRYGEKDYAVIPDGSKKGTPIPPRKTVKPLALDLNKLAEARAHADKIREDLSK